MAYIKSIMLYLVLLLSACNVGKPKTELRNHKIVETILIDTIWAANGVPFDLKTVDDRQYVVYFDRNRMMTVASRQRGSNMWIKKILDNQLIWDSHNSVVLGIDKTGHIHVSGNMHAQPMVYFRSRNPHDVNSMESLHRMVGQEESRVTYPSFFNDMNGELFYSYRIGGSGNGDVIVNHYLTESREWVRYLDTPLFEGISKNENRSAYHKKMVDKQGNFHFVWMWRWTPDVETCHNLCYAKTSDLKRWENAAGEAVSLPLKPEDENLFVDPVPSKGGLHNSRYKIILTKESEPIIAYLKYDKEGFTQLYVARFMHGAWRIRKVSDWNFRWRFIDGGALMSFGATFSLVGISDDDLLLIDWETEEGIKGQYTIDIGTLEHSSREALIVSQYPDELEDNITDIQGMDVRIIKDNAGSLKDGSTYFLKYEAQRGGFRQHKPAVIPQGPLSPLMLVKVK